jgi:hypothetical protein
MKPWNFDVEVVEDAVETMRTRRQHTQWVATTPRQAEAEAPAVVFVCDCGTRVRCLVSETHGWKRQRGLCQNCGATV